MADYSPFTELAKAQERQAQAARNFEAALARVVVNSQQDITKLIQGLDAKEDAVTITTDVPVLDEQGHASVKKVTATIKNKSKREILLDGMAIIKHRQELVKRHANEAKPVIINGRAMRSAAPPTGQVQAWVDPLIQRWLGAERRDDKICWVIGGWEYTYDLTNHKLRKDQSPRPST